MFNKNSNKSLWIVFAVLLVIVILVFNTESTKQERSFRKDLVTIDTSAITSFSLFPKSNPGQEVKFLKNDGIWNVIASDSKSYTVPNFKINNLFSELIRIKPKRMAARSQSKWTEYQVDSSATRIVVNEDGSEVLNLIIGKFAFQQPRSMSTFVRLMGEKEVYEVDGFLEMTFNKDMNSFRDETIVKSDKETWTKINITSSDSDSFELTKVDDHWTINGGQTDSAKTETALNSLARLTSTDYMNDVSSDLLPPQTSKLLISTLDGNQIEVLGYKGESQYIIHSSQNSENYFDGNKVGEKIFITKESLF